ncbi:MAG: hypothetical protein IPH78_08845 [Bacteroidetes bacterium]|nr:hypothetical protein [Bacteroidota bacterium]
MSPIHNFSNGAYVPVYFRYAGDIFETRITPYYYAELGYAGNIANWPLPMAETMADPWEP